MTNAQNPKKAMSKNKPKPEPRSKDLAKLTTYPEVNAAKTLMKFANDDSLDIVAMTSALAEQTRAIRSGNIESMESMLAAHAYTLDVMFQHLACRAKRNMDGNCFNAGQAYLKMAFRAQAQAARTIQTLGELKHPRAVAYVAQANIANGHQQINNGRAVENQNFQNKLIDGESHELPMDARTTKTASRADQALEAVESINRADNS